MDNYKKESAILYLQTLINQPLCYGIKSPDTDLYDFGFGELVEVMGWCGKRKSCTQVLHVMCRFKVIWKKEKNRIDEYHEDTNSEKFHVDIMRLVGMAVRRIGLSD